MGHNVVGNDGVFGAAMTKPVFSRIGPAGGCVFGNLVTAAGISGCILVARVPDATKGSFIGYVLFLYAITPFTVLSNMSTGPMLDRLAWICPGIERDSHELSPIRQSLCAGYLC
jgi:hypothetical protein